jgi:hypothetical protein
MVIIAKPHAKPSGRSKSSANTTRYACGSQLPWPDIHPFVCRMSRCQILKMLSSLFFLRGFELESRIDLEPYRMPLRDFGLLEPRVPFISNTALLRNSAPTHTCHNVLEKRQARFSEERRRVCKYLQLSPEVHPLLIDYRYELQVLEASVFA